MVLRIISLYASVIVKEVGRAVETERKKNVETRVCVTEKGNEVGGMLSSRGHGTKQNLKFGGSVTEVENGFGGTLYCSGHVTEQNLNFGGNVAEVWRNGPLRRTRNGAKLY